MIKTEKLTKFTSATFENPWNLLLRDCVERREKETQNWRILFNKQNVSDKSNT